MLPVFIKILILTNKTLSTSFEDGGNELCLYEPMKNSLQAGLAQLFLNAYFLTSFSYFLYHYGVSPTILFIQSLYVSKLVQYHFRTQPFLK